MSIHFIAKTNDCWLRVQLEDGTIKSLPYGLKVKYIETKSNREYFTILEGVNIGKVASALAHDGKSYLTTKISHKAGATLIGTRSQNEAGIAWTTAACQTRTVRKVGRCGGRIDTVPTQ